MAEPVRSVSGDTVEKGLASHLLAILAVVAISGFATYGSHVFRVWQQWTVLLHTGLGFVLAAFGSCYLVIHFNRTAGLKRVTAAVAGYAGALVMVAVIFSGIAMTVGAQAEATRWVEKSHVLASLALLAFLMLHLTVARVPAGKRTPRHHAWQTTGSLAARYFAWSAGCLAILTTGYHLLPSVYDDTAAVKPYSQSYGEHPFRPSQTETRTQGFMDVKRTGNSAGCASCHQEISRQWQASIHAQAASDKAYQTNINLLSQKKGMPATRYCEGCHAPVALLSGQLSDGGKLDTPGHLQEGVSCMACHGIDRVIHTRGVASFEFSDRNGYLFEGYEAWLPVRIHNFLLRLQPRQHRQDMARPPLARPELCATCHVQFMDKDMNGWDWVQMQDEYTAWLSSPYSRQTQQSFSESAIQRCQDCHFPLVEGHDPSASPEGRIRSHRALGANTAIPWFTGNREHLELTRRFLREDRVRLSIDIPDRPDSIRSNRHVRADEAQRAEVPDYVYLGETLKFNIIVSNTRVGHNFPGGTTDLNEVWLEIRLRDGQNRTLYSNGEIGQNNAVDPSSYFYRSIPVDRLGNPVWRHDLFNMVGDSFRRIIPPGKSDTVPYQVMIPGWAKTPVTISAVLHYRKFNEKYARWALKDEQVALPVVDVASDSLSIPVRTKPEVEAAPSGE